LIHDALVVTVDPEDRILEPGDIVIEGSHIAHVGPAEPDAVDRLGPFSRIVDGSRSVVIPGLVNAHTHTYATLFKGSYEQLPLDLWLVAMRAPTRALDERLLELSSTLAAVEMVRTGTTTALDHFFGNPELPAAGIEAEIRAMRRVGLRHAVAAVLMDMSWEDTLPLDPEALAAARSAADDVTRRETAQGLEGAAAFIAAYHGSDALTTCLLGPSAAHRCSDALLRGCRELADRAGVGIHLHLGEAKSHAVRNREVFGETLVGRLDRLGVLGPDVSMAHGVWLSEPEFDLVARAGASIVHNPASNLKLGSGVARIVEMRRRGVNVAVATDGPCSSDNLNMFEAIRLGGLLHTSNQVDPAEWPTARDVFRMATIDAARAVGLAAEIGSIEVGKRADLTLLRRDSVAWAALNDPYVQLVYTENGASVDRVFVNGTEVVSGGRVTGLDEEALFREVGEARRLLQPAVDAARATVAPLTGPIGRMGRALRDVRVDDMEPQQLFH
ncbi:MAG TPA: amidohydrolase, partial [Candidatus Limnocylindrales bacterium]|nr:amidohydrolase [Candidatus Limnocylindrales bacterium]